LKPANTQISARPFPVPCSLLCMQLPLFTVFAPEMSGPSPKPSSEFHDSHGPFRRPALRSYTLAAARCVALHPSARASDASFASSMCRSRTRSRQYALRAARHPDMTVTPALQASDLVTELCPWSWHTLETQNEGGGIRRQKAISAQLAAISPAPRRVRPIVPQRGQEVLWDDPMVLEMPGQSETAAALLNFSKRVLRKSSGLGAF
jgi:hypothetical protein